MGVSGNSIAEQEKAVSGLEAVQGEEAEIAEAETAAADTEKRKRGKTEAPLKEQPEGPQITIFSLSLISRSMLDRAWKSPYHLLTPLREMIGVTSVLFGILVFVSIINFFVCISLQSEPESPRAQSLEPNKSLQLSEAFPCV